jgi:hypothetical protein
LSTPINNKSVIDSLIDRAINKGDTMAYNEVHGYFLIENLDDKFFYNSIIMAHKYKYSEAYFDVFWTLTHPKTGETFTELDKETQNLALYYLIKSYEKGFDGAKSSIEEILGKNIKIPSSEFFLKNM